MSALAHLARERQTFDNLNSVVATGFKHFKLKAGLGLEADRKRLGFVREVAGKDAVLMVDVNQLWDVDEAIGYMKNLADLDLWYVHRAHPAKQLSEPSGSSRSRPPQTIY